MSTNSSVIQGSKLSALLYIIYTNKIPRLNKLMENKALYERNLRELIVKYKEVEYDSNSIVVFKD